MFYVWTQLLRYWGHFIFGLVYQNQLETTLHCIYRIVAEIERLNIYSPSHLRQHKPPHVCSHILRGGLLLQNAFPKQVRYNGPGHRPRRRRIPKPEGRLTRQYRLGGRACRKLGGAGSSPKITSIALDRAFLSLTDIIPCEVSARSYALSDVK